MVTTTPVTSRSLGSPPGELILRVQGPGRPGQVIRLRSVKCSIGSGSRCTLRLDARGIRPVHCLLLRGSQRTIVRRWAPDTRLNGNAFGDAELRPGDRLTIGPVELDVLATGAATSGGSPTAPCAMQPAQDSGAPDAEAARLAEHRRDLDHREQALQQEITNWQAEREGIQSQLRLQAEELSCRAARLDHEEARLQQQDSRYAAEQAELATQRERFQQEQAQWRSRQEAAEEALHQREATAQRTANLSQDLAREQAELAAQRERFQQEQAQWRSRQEAAEEALRQREAELEHHHDELERRAAQIRHDQENLRIEQEELRGQLAEASSYRRQEGTGLEDNHFPTEAEPAVADEIELRERDEAETGSGSEPPAGEEITEDAPVDLANVLRRLGKADLLRTGDAGDDEPDAGQSDSGQPAMPQVQRATEAKPSPTTNSDSPPEDASGHDEDVSVDEYMSQLMQRMRGGTPEKQIPQSNGPSPPERHPQSAAPRQHSERAASPPPKPAQKKPRGPAPERQGFAAMRELANISARSAVDQHARRQMVAVYRSKLAVAGTATLAGLVLSWLWSTSTPSRVPLLAATISFAIALLWGLQYAVVTGRLLIGRNGFLTFPRSGKTAGQSADSSEPGDSCD